MKASVVLTHYLGVRIEAHRSHPKGAFNGEVLTYLRTSKRGVFMVASLRDPNDQVGESLIELFDARLYLIGPQGLQLRGFERIRLEAGSQFVAQGWVLKFQTFG